MVTPICISITRIINEEIKMTLYAKFVSPTSGYAHDQKKVEDFELNSMLVVDSISMGQSSTTITLAGLQGGFNSVHFEFYKQVDDELVKHNIYRDPEYNPYIRKPIIW
ncbi:hypothetical protein KNT87_gp285 [Erwinia phage Cronus]|uniref:Uncharacterized protein n=1 Tax=Erwinia phage Cronus TaxID=2163633 RepID=A0A2S1GMG4_9CAUD|nr:hypothetical protein KNT87_gp285 [Erwinia phage Cronus]AWD90575.1 hypothetical protein [Erwinia phage Cronus]